jgi:hypothetical protein
VLTGKEKTIKELMKYNKELKNKLNAKDSGNISNKSEDGSRCNLNQVGGDEFGVFIVEDIEEKKNYDTNNDFNNL